MFFHHLFCSFLIFCFVHKNIQGEDGAMNAIKRSSVWTKAEQYDPVENVYDSQRTPDWMDVDRITDLNYDRPFCTEHLRDILYMIPALLIGGKFAVDVLIDCICYPDDTETVLRTLTWLFDNCNVDVNMPVKCYDTGDMQTFLHFAVGKGENLEIVKYLVEIQNASLSAVDSDGNTPLHKAVQLQYSTAIVEYLVKRGKKGKCVVDVNALNNNNETPLDLAYNRYRRSNDERALHIARCLEENGGVTGKQLIDDLVRAVTTSSEFAEELPSVFDTIIDVNQPLIDYNNQTLLHLAVSKNDCLKIVRFLVEHKNASLSAVDDDLNTPLHLAAQCSNNVKIMKYLVIKVHENNCVGDVNSHNNKHQTPVSVAIDRGVEGNGIAEYLESVWGGLER